MQRIVDRNYFLDKLSKDREINDLISKQSDKENLSFFENLKELRRILHLKNQTDRKIINEYNKLIVIPTGTEETLIRELNQFNKEMYKDLPEHYTLDFGVELSKENKPVNKRQTNLKTDYKKNILNLSNPYIQESSVVLDETSDVLNKTSIDPFLEKTIQDFETLLLNQPVDNKDKESYIDKILEEENYTSEVLKDDEEIYVESIEQKEKMISDIRDSLTNGNYGKLNLNKPISLSTTKYMKKLESLKKGFVKTYGSELFKKISEWVQQEDALYENVERSRKISSLRKQKLSFNKKRKFNVKTKRKF
ncbi:hypothetical protein [Spiroplasma monobiae]|uniref:Uncharacterized protein n=1 Tax=Spiroplasma monobiae MQ-1 TaxID=1336748 RepID=A0A2K9LUF3_SPISQ|nr:hypothetical protein [Spiroplasma monobiae]AUM62679.1 hypothetical protein SMONO_v1c04300 [Spiroplasma monobiae MQ-1]